MFWPGSEMRRPSLVRLVIEPVEGEASFVSEDWLTELSEQSMCSDSASGDEGRESLSIAELDELDMVFCCSDLTVDLLGLESRT